MNKKELKSLLSELYQVQEFGVCNDEREIYSLQDYMTVEEYLEII